MKSNFKLIPIILAAAIFLFICRESALAKKSEPAATIVKITGEAEMKEPGKEEWATATVNAPLFEGSAVRTKKDSEAVIVWMKGHSMKLYELSQITFTKLALEKKGLEKTELDLPAGRALASVKKLESDKAIFAVKTPAASAAVRGTQFAAEAAPEKSAFTVLEGKIAVNAQNIEVIVAAGFQTSVETGKPPAEPQPVPPEKIDELKKEVKLISAATEEGKPDAAGAAKNSNAQNAPDEQDTVNKTNQQILDQQTQDQINNSVIQQEPYHPETP